MCFILALREELINGVVTALHGFAESKIESRSCEDLRVEEMLTLLS